MKYEPSHDKQLNKKIERSEHREEVENLNWDKENAHTKVPKKRAKVSNYQRFKLETSSPEEALLNKEKTVDEKFRKERTQNQVKKQAKSEKSHEFKIHIPKDIQERNKEMQHRTPVIRKRSHQPPKSR